MIQHYKISFFLVSNIFAIFSLLLFHCSTTLYEYNINIIEHPQSQKYFSGHPVTFNIKVESASNATLNYQWQTASPKATTFTNIIGATKSSYTTPILIEIDNNKQYRCVVSISKEASINSNVAFVSYYRIRTIAGTGVAGFSGDGNPAINAQINNPYTLRIHPKGDFYFIDRANNRIRKIDTKGIISTIAGTGVAGFSGDGGVAKAAQLQQPYGIVFDSKGDMYITDSFNNRIRKIDTKGIISTIAGTGVAGFSGDGGAATAAQLNEPTSITIDSKDNMLCWGWR